MSDSAPPAPRSALTRRAVTRGLAWSVPAVAAVAAAPAFAASPAGTLTGSFTRSVSVVQRGQCVNSLSVEGSLALQGADPRRSYAAPTVTVWTTGVTTQGDWAAQAGHSRCWSGPVAGAQQTLADGRTYTPYTWTSTCSVSVTSAGTAALPAFHVVDSSVQEAKATGTCEPTRTRVGAAVTVAASGAQPQQTLVYGPVQLG